MNAIEDLIATIRPTSPQDSPGQRSDYVGHIYPTPEDPKRAAKGDLSMEVITGFDPQVVQPFKNLKDGK